MADALAKGSGLGVVPSTIGRVVVDVDEGEPGTVWDVVGEPHPALPTRRGVHGYFTLDGTGPGKRNHRGFLLGDVRGDIKRGPGSFVRFHGHGAETLAETLARGAAPPVLDADKLPAPSTGGVPCLL